ncbi:MAG: 50S ribosome-binding GTPase, partial [Candidatus Hydrothermae bacterium]|nr:50S ribosome-binding GTPase [Candidatus Hydrothermae bacterium]
MSGDPIVALATPPGVGAVAVFRISGEGSGDRLRPLFPGRDVRTLPPRTLTLRRLVHPGTGEALDQVLLVRFPGPHSYTGEEMWEVHTHGGWWLTRRLLDLFLQQGFREAKPGEFTYRAVLHGKMDLLQAQAVNELVHAGSDEGIRLALARLRGDTSDALRGFRDRLLRTWMEMEARLDFPEEVPTLDEPVLMARLQELSAELGWMVEEGERGQRWMGGHRLVILGPPNAGKSTLINSLVGAKVSIVTHKVQTTRARIRGVAIEGDSQIVFVDTPRLFRPRRRLDRAMVAAAWTGAADADVVVLMVEAHRGITKGVKAILDGLRERAEGRTVALAINKIDRPGARPDWVLDQTFDLFDRLGASDEQLDFPVVYASALKGYAGLAAEVRGGDMTPLFETIVEQVPPPPVEENGPLQLQVSSLDYNSYVGIIGIGRVQRGRLRRNQTVTVVDRRGQVRSGRIAQIYGFDGLNRIEIEQAGAPQPAIYPINLEGATPADYDQLAQTIESQLGRLDGLVHCAAMLPYLSRLKDHE